MPEKGRSTSQPRYKTKNANLLDVRNTNSNLYRPKSSNKWETQELDAHERALREELARHKQMHNQGEETNTITTSTGSAQSTPRNKRDRRTKTNTEIQVLLATVINDLNEVKKRQMRSERRSRGDKVRGSSRRRPERRRKESRGMSRGVSRSRDPKRRRHRKRDPRRGKRRPPEASYHYGGGQIPPYFAPPMQMQYGQPPMMDPYYQQPPMMDPYYQQGMMYQQPQMMHSQMQYPMQYPQYYPEQHHPYQSYHQPEQPAYGGYDMQQPPQQFHGQQPQYPQHPPPQMHQPPPQMQQQEKPKKRNRRGRSHNFDSAGKRHPNKRRGRSTNNLDTFRIEVTQDDPHEARGRSYDRNYRRRKSKSPDYFEKKSGGMMESPDFNQKQTMSRKDIHFVDLKGNSSKASSDSINRGEGIQKRKVEFQDVPEIPAGRHPEIDIPHPPGTMHNTHFNAGYEDPYTNRYYTDQQQYSQQLEADRFAYSGTDYGGQYIDQYDPYNSGPAQRTYVNMMDGNYVE